MKNVYTAFLMFLLAFTLLAGCGQTEEPSNDTSQQGASQSETEDGLTETDEQNADSDAGVETDETAAVIIAAEEETITEKEIQVEEGDILLEVMEENFDIEVTDDGFITSIEGVSQDEEAGKYWMYEINGEPAEVGAGEYELEPGDEISFELQAM